MLPSFHVDENACEYSDEETDGSELSTQISRSFSEGMSSMTGATSTDGDVIQEVPSHPMGGRPRFPTLPSTVKINVEGDFIVDEESPPQNSEENDHIHRERKDIRLPHHTDVVSHVAVDVRSALPLSIYSLTLRQIGGSLAKLVYFSREPGSADGGRLNFLNFETDRIDLCIEFIQELKQNQTKLNGSSPGQLSVMATGGGAYKFYERMRDTLHVNVVREDEMACLIMGMFSSRLRLM